MTPDLRTASVRLLSTHFPAAAVRQKARELGVVKRQGKVDAHALLVVVVLGLVVRGPTAIAQLGQIYGAACHTVLARSAFWSRFTADFARLVKWVLDTVVSESRAEARPPPGLLSGFRDVIAADASVVKVHDDLRSVWKGTRRNSARAALKVHAWVRVFTGELVKFRITREAFADSKAFGVDHALRGVLMLFDRGYASPSLWRRVDRVGGYFLTRIPAGWNPVIVSENRRHRGRARKLTGSKLKVALAGLQRQVVDVNASFRCRVRAYGGTVAVLRGSSSNTSGSSPCGTHRRASTTCTRRTLLQRSCEPKTPAKCIVSAGKWKHSSKRRNQAAGSRSFQARSTPSSRSSSTPPCSGQRWR